MRVWRGGGEGPAFASAVCSKMHALSVRWGWIEVAAGAMVLWDMVEVTEGWMDGWMGDRCTSCQE